MLDPVADKTLLVTSFLVLGSMGLIPIWLVLAVVLRDLVIMAGAVLYQYRVADLEAAPSWTSKLNTLVQLVLLVLVMTDAGPFPLPRPLIEALTWLCLATVSVSGIQYIWVWTLKARAQGWKED
jgi:cardiolipin synthase